MRNVIDFVFFCILFGIFFLNQKIESPIFFLRILTLYLGFENASYSAALHVFLYLLLWFLALKENHFCDGVRSEFYLLTSLSLSLSLLPVFWFSDDRGSVCVCPAGSPVQKLLGVTVLLSASGWGATLQLICVWRYSKKKKANTSL